MRITSAALAIFVSAVASASEFPDFLGSRELATMQQPMIPGGLQFLAALDDPPFSFVDSSSRLSGFTVYLARAICEELNSTKNCIIAGRLTKDLMSPASTDNTSIIVTVGGISKEMQGNYRFTKSILRIPARFVGQKGIADKLDFAKDLPDRKIGVVANSAHQRMLASYFPQVRAVAYSDNALLLTDLSGGKIDLAFGSGIELADWLASTKGGRCCMFSGGPYYSSEFLGEGIRFAVPAAGRGLVAQINSALVLLQKKGRIEELYLRFFPVNFY